MRAKMNKIEMIKQCIQNAEDGISKLSEEVMLIGGYTSKKIRHLLNNLGNISNNYFEIGSHRGATFCATVYGNENIKSALACDNYSELNVDNPQEDFLKNAKEYCKCEYFILVHDAFEISHISFKPSLYLYDGSHSEWAHRNALTHFYKMLPGEFIFLVDDYQWPHVKKGTQEGIKECNLEILFERELGMEKPSDHYEYWNGFGVFLLKKTK